MVAKFEGTHVAVVFFLFVMFHWPVYSGEHGYDGVPATKSQLHSAFQTDDRDACIRQILAHGEKIHVKGHHHGHY